MLLQSHSINNIENIVEEQEHSKVQPHQFVNAASPSKKERKELLLQTIILFLFCSKLKKELNTFMTLDNKIFMSLVI